MVTDNQGFWGQFSSGEGEGFHVDPDKVRKVELCHQPPGRERVRVTVVSARGQIKVFTAPRTLLARVVEGLYASESEVDPRG